MSVKRKQRGERSSSCENAEKQKIWSPLKVYFAGCALENRKSAGRGKGLQRRKIGLDLAAICQGAA